jgi:hypothetical protein
MGYLDDLEKEWRKNRKRKKWDTVERNSSLRGPEFLMELVRLSVLTEDKRSGRALFEHGIVDAEGRFTRWQSPFMRDIDSKHHAIYAKSVDCRVRLSGMSVRRACAEVAADFGFPAASFDAARKQVELNYRSWEKGRPTTIPTTAVKKTPK